MTLISIRATIKAPLNKVWDAWTLPEHIVNWNFASDDWCCPSATNDLCTGGAFSWRMEAKDGSFGFDFGGTYTMVESHHVIKSELGDGRKVEVHFHGHHDEVEVIETFEAESINPIERQRDGWQAILDNFKKYVEPL